MRCLVTGATGYVGGRAEPVDDGHGRYHQRAVFLPRGLAGHAYWAAVWPFHAVVFGGMACNIARAAERPTTEGPSPAALPSARSRRRPG